MKILSAFLLTLTLTSISEAVIVHEGEFSFSLESVKKLWAIMAQESPVNPNSRLAVSTAAFVCENPNLPEVFQPLCHSQNGRASFTRLALLAKRVDVCQICAFAACTGC